MKHGDEMPVERIRMGLCEHCKALAAKDAELAAAKQAIENPQTLSARSAASLQTEIEKWKAWFEDECKKTIHLKDELIEMHENRRQQSKELAAANEQIVSLKCCVTEHKATIDGLVNQGIEMSKELGVLKTENASLLESVMMMLQSCGKHEDRIKNLSSYQFQEIIKDHCCLCSIGQLEQLRAENERPKADHLTAAELKQINDLNAEQAKEIVRLKHRIERLESATALAKEMGWSEAEALTPVGFIRREIERLKQEKASAIAGRMEAEKVAAELRVQNGILRGENERLKARIAELESPGRGEHDGNV